MLSVEPIVLGVVSGILTSGLLLLVSQFTRHVLIPWYQQIAYDGVDISGDWYSEIANPSGNTETLRMSLEQSAGGLSGIIAISKHVQTINSVELKTYSFTGSIRDRFVTITGRNSSKKNLGIHIELLEIVGDGDSMRGKRTWYSATDKVIHAGEMHWKRNAASRSSGTSAES